MPRSAELSAQQTIQVVVLVLENNQDEVLLTQRKANAHLAHYWEFPGGKIEGSESAIQALTRECLEEINYSPIKPEPILEISHDYPEKTVTLEVFHELNAQAVITPMEGQPMRWVNKNQLHNTRLPAANQSIVDYLLGQSS